MHMTVLACILVIVKIIISMLYIILWQFTVAMSKAIVRGRAMNF